jgi:hypothetical protein
MTKRQDRDAIYVKRQFDTGIIARDLHILLEKCASGRVWK